MKKVKYLVYSLFVFLVGIGFVDAASFRVSTNTTNATVGHTVRVTVTVSGADGWEYCLNYDSSLFKFTGANSDTGGTCVKTGSMLGYKEVTFNFKSIKSGRGTFSLRGAVGYDLDGNPIKSSKGSVSVRARTQAEIEASWSDNAYLEDLKVDGYKIEPDFDKKVYEYNLEVPNNIEEVNIKGTRDDNRSSVTGLGNKKLSEGMNVFKIIVTAEKGNKKTYTLNINRKELNPINVTVDGKNFTVVRKKDLINAPSYYSSTEVDVDGTLVPGFKSDITGFTLVGLKDSEGTIKLYTYNNGEYSLYTQIGNEGFTFIPDKPTELLYKLDKLSKITINDIELDCYTGEDESDFVYLYGMNAKTGKTNWYKYDTLENAFQRYEVKSEEHDKDLYFFLAIVFALLSAITIVLVITLLSTNSKLRHKNKKLIGILENGNNKNNKEDNKDNKDKVKEEIKDEVSETKIVNETKKSKKDKKHKKNKKNEEETLDNKSINIKEAEAAIINNIAKANSDNFTNSMEEIEVSEVKDTSDVNIDLVSEGKLSKRELKRLEKLRLKKEQEEARKLQNEFFGDEKRK